MSPINTSTPNIDGETLNNLFRGKQETGIINTPPVDISILFNPNSASDFNENLVENIKFRLVGVPPDVAGQLVDIDFNQDIESAIKDVQKAYGLNPILNYKLIFKGKVITDFSQLKKLGFNPKRDTITIMAEQAGSAPNSREARLRELIISGMGEKDLIRKVGSRTILESNFWQYYGVKTLIEAKAQLLHGVFDENVDNFIDPEEVIYRVNDIEDMSNILQGDDDERITLDEISKALYGLTYNELLVEAGRINALRTLTGLENAWNLIRAHKTFDGTSLIDHYKKDTLIGVGKFFKVIDIYDNLKLDINGKPIYDIMGLKLGSNKYQGRFGLDRNIGDNLIHLVAGHGDEGPSGFGRLGLKSAKKIAEFLFKITSKQTGVNINLHGQFPNTIIYKFYSKVTYRIEYLVIGLDKNDKSVHTSYIVNQNPRNPVFRAVESISILDNYIFNI